MRCTACGGTALVEGTLVDNSGGRTIVFKPDDVSMLQSIFVLGNRGVRAYGCINCQHLQLTVEFNEEDLQRYRSFEGQQPSVLERINSEPREVENG